MDRRADVLGGEGARVSTSILAAGGLVVAVVVVVMVVGAVGAEGTLLRFLSPNTGRRVRLRRDNYKHNQTRGYSPAARRLHSFH